MSVNNSDYETISIKATGNRNDLALSNDVVISAIEVNGKIISASDFFVDNTWIVREDGSLYWRSFDQPEGMKNVISGQIKRNVSCKLVLNASKFHGILNISYGDVCEEIDEYKDLDSEDYYFELASLEAGSSSNDFEKISKLFFVLALGCFGLFFLSKLVEIESIDRNRKCYIDIMKNLAAFNVVLLHCTCGFFDKSNMNASDWFTILTINCITTFAVPLFFMITGALLINDTLSVKKMILHRLPRVYIPLLLWNVVYITYRMRCGENISFIKSLFQGGYKSQYYHLWFMYTLIGIYISLPILCKLYYLMLNYKKSEYWYYLVVLIVAPLLISTSFSYMGEPSPALWFAFGAPELALLISGKLLDQGKVLHLNYKKTTLFALGAMVSLLMIIGSTTFISNDTPNKTFFSYSCLPVFLFSFCVFGFFKSIESGLNNTPRLFKIVMQKLSDVSIGIYFSHMIIYEMLKGGYPSLFDDILSCSFMAIVIYVFCALICYSGVFFPGYLGRCFGRRSR